MNDDPCSSCERPHSIDSCYEDGRGTRGNCTGERSGSPARRCGVTPATERSPRSPRWGLMGRHWVRVGGKPFLDRLQVIQVPWFSLLLTRIYGPDEGRDPHDHSRWFASLILTGAYDETVWTDPSDLSLTRRRVHWAGSVHVMRAEHAHLITEVRGSLRTLVVAGRHRGGWSFWTPGGKVDWRDYEAPEAEGEL